MNPDLREPTPDEAKSLTEDIQAVLKKHNAEIGVQSSIQLLMRKKEETKEIPTPYGENPDKIEETPPQA